MSTAWQIGQTYSFTVYPVSLLGDNFDNVIVQSVMDAATAASTGLSDIYAAHAKLYPYLPEGTIQNDATAYNYLKLKLSDVTTPILLGIPFINDSTVSLITASTVTAVIGQVTTEDLTKIRNILIAAGYNSLTMTIK